MLQNTSQWHKAQANPTFDSGTKYNSPNYKSTTSYDHYTKPGFQPPPTQHATATHPAPSPTHYHTRTPTQYLTTPQTTIPLYLNPPPLHAIHYAISSSSTRTRSLHPPRTSVLAPQTHYPSFSFIAHLNPTPQCPGWVPANNTKGHNCE